MCLWHLLLRHVSKSDNPENLIILVQPTVRGQNSKSTPNTRTEIVQTIVLLSLTYFSIVFKENFASFSFRFLNVVSRKSGFQSPPTRVLRSCLSPPANTCWDNTDIFATSHRFRCIKDACYIMLRFIVK